MDNFSSLTDVLNYREEIIPIDLPKYFSSAKEDIAEFLRPMPKGLYLPGNSKPMFVEGETYYDADEIRGSLPVPPTGKTNFRENVNKDELTPVTDLEQIRKRRTTWLNSDLDLVVSRYDMVRLSRILTDKPSRAADSVLVASIIDAHMKKKCVKFNGSVYHKALFDALNPQHQSEVALYEIMKCFGELLDVVDEFIGRDAWCIYSLDLRGSSLFISKGIDWRIYEYYRMQFEKEDDERRVRFGDD